MKMRELLDALKSATEEEQKEFWGIVWSAPVEAVFPVSVGPIEWGTVTAPLIPPPTPPEEDDAQPDVIR